MKIPISVRTELQAIVMLTLTEEEAKALHALTVYGDKVFLEVFYKRLGQVYLRPHEKGLLSLFKKVGKLDKVMKEIDKSRNDFDQNIYEHLVSGEG